MKAEQVLKIMNARNLMERDEIENWLLTTTVKSDCIGGDYQELVKGIVIDTRDNDKLIRNASKIGRSKISLSHHCGHSYDCCGCLCSTKINAYKNGDFLTVIGRFGYNY